MAATVTMPGSYQLPIKYGTSTCYNKEREKIYAIHGSPEGLLEMRTHNSVDIFDINTRCWTKHLCTDDSKLPLTNIAGLCVIVRD